jgi:hypothetical protein
VRLLAGEMRMLHIDSHVAVLPRPEDVEALLERDARAARAVALHHRDGAELHGIDHCPVGQGLVNNVERCLHLKVPVLLGEV